MSELNHLLADPSYWDTGARERAEANFTELVVDIFFDGMQPETVDFQAVREGLVPMPGQAEGYRTALFLGTTGAGKTTLVRQLLGTDPITERFPSTSTAKTTVADTELIFSELPYRAAVTFFGRDELTDYVAECVTEAGLAAFRNEPESSVRRKLLDHVNQRFRFSYVLGRDAVEDDEDDEDEDAREDGFPPALDAGSVQESQLVTDLIARVWLVVDDVRTRVSEALDVDERDERVLAELLEEELDRELRAEEAFHAIVDNLMDAIHDKFDLAKEVGTLDRNRQGWPLSWSWETEDRTALVRALMTFSSNYAPLFGRLLTPLVNGIRVSGPFMPEWWGSERPRLVLMDGEGLGHSPTSTAALSTRVANRLPGVDSIILVDSATQPMQAAPVAALKAVVTSGNAGKLSFCFTHFDEVKGDNLAGQSARREHVLASAENALKAIGEDLGPFAERIVRRRLDSARAFVGGIQSRLDLGSASGRRTAAELESLLTGLVTAPDALALPLGRPVYDKANLVLGITEATQNFHQAWRGYLGLEQNPAAPKEHWARVKALTRRLAEGWDDEYANLRPVADLRQELQSQIYRMLQHPVRWDGAIPSPDEQQWLVDNFSHELAGDLSALASRRVARERVGAWQSAYGQSGRGSTYVRARIVGDDVLRTAAPVPAVTPSPDRNEFLHQVAGLVEEAALRVEFVLQ